jgi:hypothetical protein
VVRCGPRAGRAVSVLISERRPLVRKIVRIAAQQARPPGRRSQSVLSDRLRRRGCRHPPCRASPAAALLGLGRMEIEPGGWTGRSIFAGIHFGQTRMQYKSPLLQSLQSNLRLQHLSRRTEAAYVYWTKRFIRFCGVRHPSELGPAEVRRFLTYLGGRPASVRGHPTAGPGCAGVSLSQRARPVARGIGAPTSRAGALHAAGRADSG